MLRTFRSKIKFWSNVALWPVIIAFIAFYGWSFSGSQHGKADMAAKIYDTAIGTEDVVRMRERITQYYRTLYKDNFEQMAQNLDFQQLALDKLIDDTILLHHAGELGLQVSKDEIRTKITQTPYFQKDGTFSPNLYNAILRRMRMSPAEYEKSIQTEILLNKVSAVIESAAPVTLDELRDSYEKTNLKISCDFYSTQIKDYLEEAPVDETERRKYYEENPEDFRLEDQVKVDYVVLDPKDFEKDVDIIEEDIDDYFNDNINNYKTPEQVRASHILIRVDAGASEDAWEAASEKIDAIKQKLDEGGSFSDLAREYSQDITAENGGDLGFFSLGQMVKPFENTVWNLEIDEIGGPVKTQFGYHLIQKTGYRKGGVQPIEMVESQIRDTLMQTESQRLAREKAQEIFETTSESTTLKEVADKFGLEIKSTDFFEKHSAPPEIGQAQDMDTILFNLDIGTVSIPMETYKGVFLVSVTEKKASHISPYEKVEDTLDQKVREDRARAAAHSKLEAVIRHLEKGRTWEQAGEESGLESGNTGEFTKSGYIPKLGSYPDLVDKVFAMDVGQISGIMDMQTRFTVFRIAGKTEFDEEAFQEKLPHLRKQTLTSRQYQTLNSFLNNRKSRLRRDGNLEIFISGKESST
ncbi:peptidylprolyl isomerase [bacterium]|nr:peptidylprolyl isomerase [candidate division CSSED10-310 bacterium]